MAAISSAINEVVSISSSISANELNVKKFQNIASGSSTQLGGYWQTVYDAAPTSAQSTALVDITYGYATGSAFNVLSTVSSSQNEKVKMYRQFAGALLGDPDGLFSVNGNSLTEAFFVMFKRSIQKDELKRGTTSLIYHDDTDYLTGSDSGAATNFRQTIGGDYAEMTVTVDSVAERFGLVWYNAGVIVVDPNAFMFNPPVAWSGSKNLDALESSGSIDNLVDGFRQHVDVYNVHNQTNLMSTVFFCRAKNSEFNYSSNPTFIDDDKRIRTTSGSNVIQTRAYITKVGGYDVNDVLLWVASLAKPVTKSPDSETVCRVRLDF